MLLTTKSEYSILALIYLARNSKKGFIKIANICSTYSIPQKYLEQLFYPLKQNGYVKTQRGANGGYQLAKPTAKISLAEIVRLMDGPIAPTAAVSKYFYSHTPLEKEEKAIKIFKEIRDYLSNKLEVLTLEDLL